MQIKICACTGEVVPLKSYDQDAMVKLQESNSGLASIAGLQLFSYSSHVGPRKAQTSNSKEWKKQKKTSTRTNIFSYGFYGSDGIIQVFK